MESSQTITHVYLVSRDWRINERENYTTLGVFTTEEQAIRCVEVYLTTVSNLKFVRETDTDWNYLDEKTGDRCYLHVIRYTLNVNYFPHP